MKNRKILIADDEEDVLDILQKRLREKNYFVTAVSRGKDAIDIAKLDKPDLVLLDIVLPDIDGYSVAAALREDASLRRVPIVFLTGKDLEYEGIEKRILDLGAYDFLRKPCTFEEILAKVKEVIG